MRWLLALLLVPLTAAAPAGVQAAEGTVNGTVTPTSIAQEVEVCVAESQPPEPCTSPGPDGSYSLTGLQTRPLKIEFIPPYRSRYMVEYWDHVYTLGEATPVPLSSGNLRVDGADAALVSGGVIKGTVTGVGGPPLTGVEVCAFDSQGVAAACSQTDGGGLYELHSLSPGSYRVRFFARGPSAEYLSEYYDGAGTLAAATPIALAPSEVREGVDAELAKGSQIRGVITAAADGAPLASIPVCLFATGGAQAEQCVFSDPNGQYTFTGLASGSYQVGFSLADQEITGASDGGGEEDGYMSQYYDRVSNRAAAATLSLVGSQVLANVDAGLLPLSQPAPLAPPPPVAESLIAPAPPIGEPGRTATKSCRRHLTRKKVRGRYRCVKVRRRGRHHRHHGKRRELFKALRALRWYHSATILG